MTNRLINNMELKDYGFEIDAQVSYILIEELDLILDYFSNDSEMLDEIERLKGKVVLEIIADIDEDGVVTSFFQGVGTSPATVLANNEDDLRGVTEWLRSGKL